MIELKPQTLALWTKLKAASIRKLRTIFAASGPIFCTTVLPGYLFPQAPPKALRLCPPGRTHQRDAGRFEAMLYAQLLNVSDALESDNKT
ncbi:MAG: hypothetical protein ACLSBB_10245 [Ruthenibacterium lactatiformans]